jgi:hypothetical protein
MGLKKPEPLSVDEVYEITLDDAAGCSNPVALSPEAKADFDRQMAACKTAYQATDEPLAAAEAVTLVRLFFPQAMPAWLEALVVSIIIERRTGEQARRHRESMRHMIRYQYIHSFRRQGVRPIRKAAERAKEVLKGTDIANVTVDEIIESYWKVRHDIEAGRQLEYFFLKDPRYCFADGDAPLVPTVPAKTETGGS